MFQTTYNLKLCWLQARRIYEMYLLMKRSIAHGSMKHSRLPLDPTPLIPFVIAVMFLTFTAGQTRERETKWMTLSGKFSQL
jgi:hypothetical protein